jgi:hypothetical protein
MPGNEEIGYPGGFSSLGEGSYNSQIPYAYYQSLIDAKVIDCSYDALFPEDEYDNKSISFRQALLIDFTQRKIDQDTQMALECIWKSLPVQDAEADRDLNILVFSLQEAALIRDKDRYHVQVL